MSINNKLFKFAPPTCPNMSGETGTQAIQSILKKNRVSRSAADVPVPVGAGIQDINIVKQFRWTKSSVKDVIGDITPTISLREMLVISPSFFHNVSTLLNQIASDTGVASTLNSALQSTFGPSSTETLPAEGQYSPEAGAGTDASGLDIVITTQPDHQAGPSWIANLIGTPAFLDLVGNLTGNMTNFKDKIDAFKAGALGTTKFNFPAYMREYENLYGVIPTRFMYRMPYLEDNYKQISNSWSTGSGFATSTINRISDFLKIASPSTGVDIAKTYDYPDSGPSHDINFFLDNTVIDGESHYEKNFRLIYLLLYQNLPNRITHSALTPPVIYQASLPGVFNYRWSYLSKLNVNFIGTRRPKNVVVGDGDAASTVIIPEGYEVQLTLTSLIPETKNIMYDSIRNPITSSIEENGEEKPFHNNIPTIADPMADTIGGSPTSLLPKP